jgi:hypothetical protein
LEEEEEEAEIEHWTVATESNVTLEDWLLRKIGCT